MFSILPEVQTMSKSEQKRLNIMEGKPMDTPRKVYIKGLTVYQSEPANIGVYESYVIESAYILLQKKLETIKYLWKEHERTKFLSDGSHFQIDIQLNAILKD